MCSGRVLTRCQHRASVLHLHRVHSGTDVSVGHLCFDRAHTTNLTHNHCSFTWKMEENRHGGLSWVWHVKHMFYTAVLLYCIEDTHFSLTTYKINQLSKLLPKHFSLPLIVSSIPFSHVLITTFFSESFQLRKTLCRWPSWRTPCWGTFSGATRSGCGLFSMPMTPSPYALDLRSHSWLTWWGNNTQMCKQARGI